MRGWFDVFSLSDIMARQDEDGMLKSVQIVQKLITDEVDAGISSDRIIVGGFSQGAARFLGMPSYFQDAPLLSSRDTLVKENLLVWLDCRDSSRCMRNLQP